MMENEENIINKLKVELSSIMHSGKENLRRKNQERARKLQTIIDAALKAMDYCQHYFTIR